MDLEAQESKLPSDDVLTLNDVMTHLKLGRNNTYKLFQLKLFPSYKIGNQYFIRKEAYENWFKKLDGKEIII